MKIGLRMPNMAKELGVPAVVEWAAGVGLQAIDLAKPNPQWVQAVHEHGLELGTIDTAGRKSLLSPDPKEQQAGVEAAKERIAEAAELGAKVLFEVLVPPDPNQSRSDSFAIWKEVYPEVVKEAEARGVKIAIEPWPGPEPTLPNLGSNPDMLRRIFAEIPSETLGLCYDPSHFHRLGIDPIRLLEEFSDRIYWVHAKDCKIIPEGMYVYGTVGESFGRRYRNGGGSWRYCIPGHGDLNWEEIIFHLYSAGYDDVLSIELEDHQFADSPERQKRAIELAMGHLSRCF